MKTILFRNSAIKITVMLTFLIASSANISSAQNEIANSDLSNNEIVDLYSEVIFSNDIDFSLEPSLLFYGWQLEESNNNYISETDDFNKIFESDSDSSDFEKVNEYLSSLQGLLNTDLSIEELESLFIL